MKHRSAEAAEYRVLTKARPVMCQRVYYMDADACAGGALARAQRHCLVCNTIVGQVTHTEIVRSMHGIGSNTGSGAWPSRMHAGLVLEGAPRS